MAELSESRIAELLVPYLGKSDAEAVTLEKLLPQLSLYLDLLLRWNARTNLTAIRDPEEIVRRHFGESLFTGTKLQPLLPPASKLLDFGSGAGFPGLPIQMLVPGLQCTLAESQGKKAAFLREAARSTGARAEVWSGRVEAMAMDRAFQCVTMRAVDDMDASIVGGAERVAEGGILAILAGEGLALPQTIPFASPVMFPIPESKQRVLYLYARQ